MLSVKLVVERGKPVGQEIPIKGPQFLIGRGTECHLRPNSELISRLHTALLIDESEVRLKDLGSTNGTLVNGQRVEGEVVLYGEDLIQVGPLAFRITIEQVQPVASPAEPAVAQPAVAAQPAVQPAPAPPAVQPAPAPPAVQSTPAPPAVLPAPAQPAAQSAPAPPAQAPAAAPASPVAAGAEPPPAAPAAASQPTAPVANSPAAPGQMLGSKDAGEDEIDRWLMSDSEHDVPDSDSGVFSGDTQMIAAMETKADEQLPQMPEDLPEDLPEGEPVEELQPEGNDPKPKAGSRKTKGPQAEIKKTREDTSNAAADILRKMMERRR